MSFNHFFHIRKRLLWGWNEKFQQEQRSLELEFPIFTPGEQNGFSFVRDSNYIFSTELKHQAIFQNKDKEFTRVNALFFPHERETFLTRNDFRPSKKSNFLMKKIRLIIKSHRNTVIKSNMKMWTTITFQITWCESCFE